MRNQLTLSKCRPEAGKHHTTRGLHPNQSPESPQFWARMLCISEQTCMKGATAVASGTEINFHIHIQPLRLYTTRQRVVDVIAHATGPLPPWKHNIPSPRRWEQGRWQQRAAGETGRGQRLCTLSRWTLFCSCYRFNLWSGVRNTSLVFRPPKSFSPPLCQQRRVA